MARSNFQIITESAEHASAKMHHVAENPFNISLLAASIGE
jgi:hypothetical protein